MTLEDKNKPPKKHTSERADEKKSRPVFVPMPQDETSGVAAFFGTWPGDETEEELLALLTEIDG